MSDDHAEDEFLRAEVERLRAESERRRRYLAATLQRENEVRRDLADLQASIAHILEAHVSWCDNRPARGGHDDHDRQVQAQALRDAVRDMRAAREGNWNLPDPRDPEVAYSVDRWLEVRADRIERGEQ